MRLPRFYGRFFVGVGENVCVLVWFFVVKLWCFSGDLR
jgi:hypothetical protein